MTYCSHAVMDSKSAFNYKSMRDKKCDVFGDYDGFDSSDMDVEKSTIQHLDFTGHNFIDVGKLSHFSNIREVVLDQNALTTLQSLPHLRDLTLLSLNNNMLQSLDETLTILADRTPNLTFLSLLGNRICPDSLTLVVDGHSDDYQRYRYKTIYHLPKLKFLDSSRVHEVERNRAIVHGKFLKVARPVQTFTREKIVTADTHLRPLSNIDGNKTSHARPAFVTTSSRQYYGKQSEGNRFIRNDDL